MSLHFNECEVGRYLLGPPGFIMVSIAILIQTMLIYAILTSPSHKQNVCYRSIMIIGVLTLFQLFFQFEVYLDVFACGSISPLADAIFAGLACRMTICTIELYNFVLVLNRLVIILLPPHVFEKQINWLHELFNYTCWLVNIPIWIAIAHPSCMPIYISFSPKTEDTCVNDGFLAHFDYVRNVVFVVNFFAYLLLLVGMRIKYTARHSSDSLKGIELRILMTSMGQFINLGLLTLLTVYFETFSEDVLLGKIVFRVIRTLYPCCNVFLTFILDKPLRRRLMSSKRESAHSSAAVMQLKKSPPTVTMAWT